MPQVFRLFCIHVRGRRDFGAFWNLSYSVAAGSFSLSLGTRTWSHHRGTCQRVLWSQNCISDNCSNIWTFHLGLGFGTELHNVGRLSLLRWLPWECSGLGRRRHECRSLAAYSGGSGLSLLLRVPFPWASLRCAVWICFHRPPC